MATRQYLSRDQVAVPGVSREGDGFGYEIASGDFDGDGYADLAVNTPYDSSPDGSGSTAGTVTVMFGGKSGTKTGLRFKDWPNEFVHSPLTFSGMVAADFDRDGYDDLVLTTPAVNYNAFWVPGGPEFAQGKNLEPRLLDPLGELTYYMRPAAGDVNGDSYPDLVLSSHTEGQWRTMLYLGGAQGLDPVEWQLLTNGGPQVVVGNFDGDKYADVAVGNPLITVSGRGSAGTVRIWHGSANGIDTARGSQTITQDSPGVPGSVMSYGEFGTALAAGDYNGDGRADLAITALRQVRQGRVFVGYDSTVNVLFGTSAGIAPATGKFQVFSEKTAGLPGANTWPSAFAEKLSARDFNRDGRSELVVGSPQYNNSTGYVAVVPGTTTGLKLASTKGFFPKGLGVPALHASFGATLER